MILVNNVMKEMNIELCNMDNDGLLVELDCCRNDNWVEVIVAKDNYCYMDYRQCTVVMKSLPCITLHMISSKSPYT